MTTFALVPVAVSRLSARAVQVYVVLDLHADYDTGEAFPSRARLARLCACSVDTIDRAVAELVKARHVKVKRARGLTSTYLLTSRTRAATPGERPVDKRPHPCGTPEGGSRNGAPQVAAPMRPRTIFSNEKDSEPELMSDELVDNLARLRELGASTGLSS